MRYISVCSGIEAATVAWKPLGWEPVAFAEIEPFPCRVLKTRYPDVPNLGDITKVDWRNYAGAVDLVVGGTPCQSFSVAGKREGLEGESGLVREYFRLLSEVKPRWFVWENVPGSLSSNGGDDFRFILDQWHQLGYNVAFRVLDAQYYGVAQRRRRVFAVGHLTDWRYPAKVLFESSCLRGDPPPRREKRQADPNRPSDSLGKTSREGIKTFRAGDFGRYVEDTIASTMKARDYKDATDLVIGRKTMSGKDVFPTLQANSGRWLGNQECFSGDYYIGEPATFCIAGNTIDRQVQNGGNGNGYQKDISYTLNTVDRHAVGICEQKAYSFYPPKPNSGPEAGCNETDVARTLDTSNGSPNCNQGGIAVLAFKLRQGKDGGGKGFLGSKEKAFTLACGQDQQIYVPSEQQHTYAIDLRNSRRATEDGSTGIAEEGDPAFTLTTAHTHGVATCADVAPTVQCGPPFSRTGNDRVETDALIMQTQAIRRLTPLECERLQGFPDNYTLIDGATDGARYKALGNSMAVPCMAWIGRRIQEVEDEMAEKGTK